METELAPGILSLLDRLNPAQILLVFGILIGYKLGTKWLDRKNIPLDKAQVEAIVEKHVNKLDSSYTTIAEKLAAMKQLLQDRLKK